MPRPRLGPELKKPSDYHYDFPQQREIAAHLSASDIMYIAKRLKYTRRTIYYWCEGLRRNAKIEQIAKLLSEHNKEKIKFAEMIRFSES